MQSILIKHRTWLLAPVVALTLAACSSDDSNFDFEASVAAVEAVADENRLASPPEALFSPDPANPALPFPTNLFFVRNPADPRPEDGLLRIPIAPSADQSLANPQVALNQQNGFSTVAPISTTLSKPVDPDTLRLGDTVRIYEVTNPTEPAALGGFLRSAIDLNGQPREITNPQEIIVTTIGEQIVLLPGVPLKPSTSYLVVLTNGILDMQGQPLQASLTYNLLKGQVALTNPSLEGLRQGVNTHLAFLNDPLAVAPENVALSWVFTTQSIRDVLQAVKDNSAASTLVMGPTGTTTNTPPLPGFGFADVYAGTLDLPYFQTAVGEDGNPLPALSGFWQNAAGQVPGATNAEGVADFTPVKTSDVKVPVLMTLPNTTAAGGTGGVMPPDGWPVTIFQHGITGDRTNLLGIADAMANAGRAVIAIDLPMHGLAPSSPLHASNNPLGPVERTFDIDAVTVDETTGAQTPGPDGVVDSSGTHFYNLANLANTRDNLRQAVADLFVLRNSLASAQIEGVMLDTNNLTFVGHSLGAIVGTTMLSYDNTFQAATLGMPGGGIAQLLANSENIGPSINAGLAGAGIETGSAQYNQFLAVAQTMIDSGDPINHASILADNGTPRIHLIEVIGDKTIPNFVSTAPLAGTEPLIALLRLPGVNATVVDGNAAVRFTEGDHASLLRPTEESPAATVEMQTQAAGFALSQGATLPIGNADILQAPAPQ